MGNSYGTETLLSSIRTPQCIMNHHGSGYYDHIIACILFYTIVMGTSHSTVPDSLALYMQLSGELIGSVDTIYMCSSSPMSLLKPWIPSQTLAWI